MIKNRKDLNKETRCILNNPLPSLKLIRYEDETNKSGRNIHR